MEPERRAYGDLTRSTVGRPDRVHDPRPTPYDRARIAPNAPTSKESTMKLRLIRIGLVLAGNALGLLIASILIDDLEVSGAAFVIAVVVFTVLTLLLDPVVSRLAEKYADALTGGAALISTALALLLTAWISDGLAIDGAGTWLLATILIWLVTAIVGVVLARLFLPRARD
jgi:uncharacterized membrane protein YvlD (DUF360 family)